MSEPQDTDTQALAREIARHLRNELIPEVIAERMTTERDSLRWELEDERESHRKTRAKLHAVTAENEHLKKCWQARYVKSLQDERAQCNCMPMDRDHKLF